MGKPRKIGLLGGTFDPIHLGHLHIARAVMEVHQLDAVVFIPARQNPLKAQKCFAGDKDRLAMVTLAIEGEPHWSIDDRELRRDGPSYTFTTVSELVEESRKAGRNDAYLLILGEDSAQSFHKWYKSEALASLVALAVVERPGHPSQSYKGSPEVIKALERGRTQCSLSDISSTEIRERLFKGLSCDHLLPTKVLDYIKAHSLYCNLIGE